MPTKLIRLQDGTLIEAEVPEDEARQISGGVADKVGKSLEQIEPLLVQICKPVASAWDAASRNIDIEQAEVELGLSFEGEGNIYITKAKAGASLTIKLTLKRSASQGQ